MAKLFSIRGWLRRGAVAARQDAAPAPGSPTGVPRLIDLDEAKLAAQRAALDGEARRIFEELEENRIDKDTLAQAYAATPRDAQRRQALTRQFEYSESRGATLEAQHAEVIVRLRTLDATLQLREKQAWLEKLVASTQSGGLDMATQKTMIEQAVAESEHSELLLREMFDTLEDAAQRSQERRNIGLCEVQARMEARLKAMREAQAEAAQESLSGLADDAQAWFGQHQAGRQPQGHEGGAQ